MTSVLSDPIFHDEDKARAHFEALRWPEGRVCPHCGTVGNSTLMQGKSHRAGLYKCKDCRKAFTATMGTVFERSHIPLTKWLLATHLMCASKKGMSALQLHRMLGFGSYKTAWFMCHRIREAMKPGEPEMLGGQGMIVEADATYIGGKEANKSVTKRNSKNIGGMGKAIVHTLVERGGRARSQHITDVTGNTLREVLFGSVHTTSSLMTDTAGGYMRLGKAFARHEMVDHGRDEYVRGDAYSNTVEGFFSILKRGIIGTFHYVSKTHLHRYLAEFDFRYSNRSALGIEDVERATLAVRGTVGKRLMYWEGDSMRRRALVASWVIPAPAY